MSNQWLIGSCFVVLAGVLSTSVSAAEHTKDSLETVKKNVTEKKAVLVDVREKTGQRARGGSRVPAAE